MKLTISCIKNSSTASCKGDLWNKNKEGHLYILGKLAGA